MYLKPLFFSIALTILTLLSGAWSAAYASAQIIGVYENCHFKSAIVIVTDASVPGNISVEAEIAAAESKSFDDATAAAKQVLTNYGIKPVAVERRGYDGCARPSSGEYVQALGHYCEGHLVRAEVLVDGRVFATLPDKKITFEDFVELQRKRLREKGIFEEPQITVQNAENCEEPKNS